MGASLINARYKIKRKLSEEGNMSTVFLCADIDSDDSRLVVVKLLNKNSDIDELSKKVFFREVESLERLSHPHIVSIFDKGYDEKQENYFIVLDYVDGKNLNELFDEISNWELSRKIELFNQILEPIEYLHNKEIVHRDLKPSNIMLNEDGFIKIIDFGISKAENTFYSEYTTVNIATPKYASVEQLKGEPVTKRSDIYSLGLIIYEILVGNKISEHNNIDINSIPENLRPIISKMISRESEQRYANIREIKNDLIEINSEFSKQKSLVLVIPRLDKIAKNLHEEGYIDKNEDIKATVVMSEDFKEYSYICWKNNSRDSYYVLGKKFALVCCINDGKCSSGLSRLAVLDIHFKTPVEISQLRTLSYEIPYRLSISATMQKESPFEIDAVAVVNAFKEFSEVLEKRKIEKAHESDIIRKWTGVLNLQRQILSQNKSAVKYKSFTYSETEDILQVELDNDFEDLKFNSDDILAMTDKYSSIPKKVGKMSSVKNNILFIDLLRDVSVERISQMGSIGIDKASEESLLNRQQKAVSMIKYKETPNPKICDIIFNPELATSKNNVILSSKDCAFKTIDNSKLRCLEGALAADDLYLLQGPPGTGKTTFISELVYQILKDEPNSKILVASQSNVAVDHALLRIKETMPSVFMIRVGNNDKFSERVLQYSISSFTKNWIEEVCHKCDEAINAYKKAIGIDDSIANKNDVIVVIESLKTQTSELAIKIDEVKIEKAKIELLYSKWMDVISKVDSLIIDLLESQEQTSDAMLIDYFDNCALKIDELKTQMNTVIKETTSVSQKKLDLENQYAHFEKEILSKKREMLDWMSSELNANTDEEYFEEKVKIEQLLKENQEKYNHLSKLKNISEDWQRRIRAEDDSFLECIIGDISVIGATCIGIASLTSRINLQFDWVIIDEAGRATPPEIFVPLSMAKKVILVGDQKQLPPVVDEALEGTELTNINVTKKDLEESLFEYLEENLSNNCKNLLIEQYRMNPAIGQLISDVFYDSTLISKTNYENKSLTFRSWGKKALVWLSTNSKEETIDKGTHNVFRNRSEVDVIFKHLQEMNAELKNNGLTKSVAIITGYKAQKDLIVKIYESQFKNRLDNLIIEIDTIDAFQGRETDIVFYSIVRSNSSGNIGFLRDSRRLNVAFSRAKELLVIVGNHQSVTTQRQLNNQANPFIKVLEYIYTNKEYCILKEVN